MNRFRGRFFRFLGQKMGVFGMFSGTFSEEENANSLRCNEIRKARKTGFFESRCAFAEFCRILEREWFSEV